MINPRIIIVIVLIAIFIWTMFASPPFIQNTKMRLANIASAPLRLIATTSNYINDISRLFYTDKEKSELKNRVVFLERKITELKELYLENKRLRQLLNFKESAQKSSIAALVIGRDPNNWASVIFIDKGQKDGIAKDMVVVSNQGLVGRVREVGKTISKVMLINDVDSKAASIVQNSREQGLLIGTPEGRCKLIYLSLEAQVAKNDMILTSGTSSVYPKGMVIGKVLYVAKEKGSLYKYAIVKPASELSKLEEVLCIK